MSWVQEYDGAEFELKYTAESHIILGFDYDIENLSYSVTREMAPVYVLGDTDAAYMHRGRRGIAGEFKSKYLIPEKFREKGIITAVSKEKTIILTGVELLEESIGIDEKLYKYVFVARYIEVKFEGE